MITIKVPATSANLGPGFDSLGVALTLYLTVTVVSESETWLVEHSLGAEIPSDKENLVIRTALSLCPDLKPHHLRMTSEIPAARGLGSSSAAIVAGIELANQLAGLELSADEKVQTASRLEGHPDNVLPALMGNFAVGTMLEEKVYWKVFPLLPVAVVGVIPAQPLLTKTSRQVLPAQISFPEAVQVSGVANVLVAALVTGDFASAGKMMEKDAIHEPYRSRLVPELQLVRQAGREFGAYGTYLSGAGTTVASLVEKGKAEEYAQLLRRSFPDCQVKVFDIDEAGVQVS